MNVLLAQLRPALRNTSRNLETVRKILAGSGDVDLVVFPELFLSGYTTSKPEELALDLEGSEMDAIARLARENSTAVILGVPERAGGYRQLGRLRRPVRRHHGLLPEDTPVR